MNTLGGLVVGFAALAMILSLSIHKIDEGHVGVYYRVRKRNIDLIDEFIRFF